MTVRADILAYIKTILQGVSDLTEISVDRANLIDLETVKFPAAFVFSGTESRVTDPSYDVIGYETWRWNVAIEVFAQNKDMEILLGTIHEKMHSGETMNGKAVTSYRTGVDMLIIDPIQSIKAMLIDYEIVYRHQKGGP